MTREEPMSESAESMSAEVALPIAGGAAEAGAYVHGVHADRRSGLDRRERLAWSLVYGGVWPRRRSGRRASDHHRPVIDWHGPGLLTSSILILLLCAADAFLTLLLLTHGAYEANPVMAMFVYDDVRSFAALKMALTGGGVLALVAVARFRVFGFMRVGMILHAVLVGYAALIAYELLLLSKLTS
jgi:hypothetical protein